MTEMIPQPRANRHPAIIAPRPSDPELARALQVTEEALQPFIEAQVVERAELQILLRLTLRAGSLDASLIVALSLALRAAARRLEGVAIEEIQATLRQAGKGGGAPITAQAVRESPLVSEPDAEETAPFVLDGERLYTQRCWSQRA